MPQEHFSLALFEAFNAFNRHDRTSFSDAVTAAKSNLADFPEAVAQLDSALEFFPQPDSLNHLHRAAEYVGMVASLGYVGPERRSNPHSGPRERRRKAR